ncbi:hypothetical protein CW732_18495 [Olleya sp. Bg11-27]|nr:hypothetical protein CW732_18495 [Olleya sp. Bg11-27]
MFNCDAIIEVEDISNKTITILAPVEGSSLTTSNVVFSWQSVEDTENYHIQIANPTFTNAIEVITDSLVTSTNFTVALTTNTYEWRVRAENSGYQTAYASQSFSVTETDAVDISNETVVLLAPADGLVFDTTDTINFSWETVLNADSYVVQIATPSFADAIEIIEDQTTTATSFSVSTLDVNSYEWRVKATNSDYQTNYTTQAFTIE